MNAIDESAIREQLARAVEVIEPVAPPLDGLRTRARRRSRARRTGWGMFAVAAVAAVVLIAVLAVPGGREQTLQPAKAPSRASLISFASAHHALHRVVGPYRASNGRYYGAYTVNAGIQVVTYHHNRWVSFAPVDTLAGNGRSTVLMKFDPSFQMTRAMDGSPSIYVRVVGADVSYYGFVIYFIDGNWYNATFLCPHNRLCRPGTGGMPYFHRNYSGVLTSVINDCSPSCAAGTDYRLNWKWLTKFGVFKATKVTKLHL